MVSSPRQQEKWPFPGTRRLRGREGRAPGEASSHPRDSLKTPRVCRARFPGHPIAQLLCLHLSKRHPSPPADTVLTPRPASTAVLSGGTAQDLEPHVAATGSFGKRHRFCRTPAQSPRGTHLARRRRRTDGPCCPPVRSPRTLAFLTFGCTKPVPTQGLCTCPLSAWHPHSRSPRSTWQHWSPFKCLTDLSSPSCPCARPAAPGHAAARPDGLPAFFSLP